MFILAPAALKNFIFIPYSSADHGCSYYLVQCAAGVHGFFWPKIFWDFLTKNLDGAVKPVPVLQILNVLFGILSLAWEWPLKPLAGTAIHRSIEIRLLVFPISTLCAILLYQGTNSALYYLIGMIVYFWAYSEGEVSDFISIILPISACYHMRVC